MLKPFQNLLLFCGFIFLFTFSAFSQEPTPTVEDEPIKILTEEVNLNVRAQTETGKSVSTLKASDLLIVDNGMPQEITKVERIPANVLLLLDTGAELNFVKSLRTTRLVAKAFIYGLNPEDSLSVMQYYDKVETLYDWGSDYTSALEILDTKLYTGKRSRFSDALNAAVDSFKSRPMQNRHLVLVSDGAESVADSEARQQAQRNLRAANITIHVISYTQLEERSAQKSTQRIKWGDGRTKPRVDPMIWEELIKGMGLPNNSKEAEKIREHLRMLNTTQALVIIDLDNEKIKKVRKKREDWRINESEMLSLSEDTGGIFRSPEEPENLFRAAIEIANAVDSYYIVTYLPKTYSTDSSERKVRVSTNLNGVRIQSRTKIVMPQNEAQN